MGSSIKKYRKKSVEIIAIQFDGTNRSECLNFIGMESVSSIAWTGEVIKVVTPEGTMTAQVNDYIIRGVQGEFYPCKPDIFDMTYSEVTQDALECPECCSDLTVHCSEDIKYCPYCGEGIEVIYSK